MATIMATRTQSIMATSAQSRPLERRETSNLIGSDKVEGTPVCRPDGERVGQIERIMIDKLSGKVAYAVMSFPITRSTSSARASSVGGTSRPSALAVFRLTMVTSFVGNSTGKSAGLLPLRILSTKSAARR
jgi:hypothetical protein